MRERSHRYRHERDQEDASSTPDSPRKEVAPGKRTLTMYLGQPAPDLGPRGSIAPGKMALTDRLSAPTPQRVLEFAIKDGWVQVRMLESALKARSFYDAVMAALAAKRALDTARAHVGASTGARELLRALELALDPLLARVPSISPDVFRDRRLWMAEEARWREAVEMIPSKPATSSSRNDDAALATSPANPTRIYEASRPPGHEERTRDALLADGSEQQLESGSTAPSQELAPEPAHERDLLLASGDGKRPSDRDGHETWARPEALVARMVHVFGAAAEGVPVELGSTRPGQAAAVTVDARIHIAAPTLDTTADLVRLGHEAAHAVQQRRGRGEKHVGPTRRATLEAEAHEAGQAFARARPFTVRHHAPRSVPLYDRGESEIEAEIKRAAAKEREADKQRIAELVAKLPARERALAPDLVEALLRVDPGFVTEALEAQNDRKRDENTALRFFKQLYIKGVYRQQNTVIAWWCRQAGVKKVNEVVNNLEVNLPEVAARLKVFLSGSTGWEKCFEALRFIERNLETMPGRAVDQALPDSTKILLNARLPDVSSVRTIDDAVQIIDVWTVGVRASLQMRRKVVAAHMAKDRAEIRYAETELDTWYAKVLGWEEDLRRGRTSENNLNRSLIDDKQRSLVEWQKILDGKDGSSKVLNDLVKDELPTLRTEALATKEKLRGLEGKRGKDEATVKKVTQDAGKDFGRIKAKIEQLSPRVNADIRQVYVHIQTVQALNAETKEILAREPAGFFEKLASNVASIFTGFWDQMKKVDWIEVVEIALEIAGAVLTGGGVIVAKIGAWVAKLATYVGPLITTVTTVKDALKTLTNDSVAGIKTMFTIDGFVDSVVDMFFGKDPLEGLPEVTPPTESGDDKKVGGTDGITKLANAIGRIAKHAVGGYAKVTSFLRTQFAHVNFSQKPWFRNLAGVAAALVQGVDAVENPTGVAEQGARSLRETIDRFFAGVSARFETITGPIKAMASGVLEPTKLFENLLEKGLEWVLNLLITNGPSATLSAALRGVQKLLGAGKTIAGELMNLTIAGEPVGQMLVGMIAPAIKGLPVFSEIQSLVAAVGGVLAELAGGLQSQLGDLRSAVSAELSSGVTFLANFLGITLPTEQGADPKKPVQRSAKADDGGAMAVDDAAERSLASSSGRPLEAGVRARMEESFGRDFSSVRVHTDGHAADAAAGVRAHALAQGHNIYFASGAYKPGTRQGDELLAHELTHVVQQNAAPPLGSPGQSAPAAPGVRAKRATSAVGDAAEQQADRVGRGIAAGDPTAAREVSPHLPDDRTLHRKSGGAAKQFKDKFKLRLLAFGQAVKGWDRAVKTASVGKRDLKEFVHAFVLADPTTAFVAPLGADHGKFLAALDASLNAGELPSVVRTAVGHARSLTRTKAPKADKHEKLGAATRMRLEVWNAYQYLYGIASLVRFASGLDREDATKSAAKSKGPDKRDLGAVTGFVEACEMVAKASTNSKDPKLMVFLVSVDASTAIIDGGDVLVGRQGNVDVTAPLLKAVQKSADKRFGLMQKHWVQDLKDYSQEHESVLDPVATSWNAKTVGETLRIVPTTAQAAANRKIKTNEVEENLKLGPKSLGTMIVKPMADDLSVKIKDALKGPKYEADRANVGHVTVEREPEDEEKKKTWVPRIRDERIGAITIGVHKGGRADIKLMMIVDGAKLGGEKSIVAFMLLMARDKKVTVGANSITWDDFNDRSRKHPMSWHIQSNRGQVKNRFRGAMDKSHEWIPSNMIARVIELAMNGPKDDINPAKWIYAQHLTRTLTRMIIYTPRKEFLAKGSAPPEARLTGHSGALYLVREKDGEEIASPQTGGGEGGVQSKWHAGLRDILDGNIEKGTPESVLAQLQEYAKDTVWNGKLGALDPSQPIDYTDAKKEPLKDDKGRNMMTLGQLAQRQKDYHDEIQATFVQTISELANYTL